MKRAVLLAVLGPMAWMGWAAPPAGALEVSGDVVVSKVDSTAYPQIAMEVAPPRLLATSELGPDAFTVTENEVRRNATVTRLPNTSLQLAIVIDPSVSAKVFFDTQGAVLDFLLRLPLGTRVSLVSAARQAQVTLPSTLDLGAATSAVGDLAPTQGRALFDAIRAGERQLPAASGARRAVVVFAAGADRTSAASLATTAQQLKASGTRLYSVELPAAGGDDALQSVVDATGGLTIKTSTTELVGAYQRVADVLLNQYRLTFRAESHGRARLGVRVNADGLSGASSLSVQLGAPATANPAPATLDRSDGGSRPLAAWLTIGLALLAGGVLVLMGQAGLRARAADGTLGGNGKDHDVVAV
jgi:hypothetical protein